MFDTITGGKTQNQTGCMQRGFTLLETVIYTTILALTFSFVLFTVYEIIDSRYRILARVEVEEETNFIMRKIAWMLSGVERINQPAPASTSSVLSVDKTNFAGNPVVLEVVASRAAISYGGGAPVRLQSTSALIKKLVFEQVASGGNTGVKVNLEVGFVPRQQLVIYDATSSIETTIYIRK